MPDRAVGVCPIDLLDSGIKAGSKFYIDCKHCHRRHRIAHSLEEVLPTIAALERAELLNLFFAIEVNVWDRISTDTDRISDILHIHEMRLELLHDHALRNKVSAAEFQLISARARADSQLVYRAQLDGDVSLATEPVNLLQVSAEDLCYCEFFVAACGSRVFVADHPPVCLTKSLVVAPLVKRIRIELAYNGETIYPVPLSNGAGRAYHVPPIKRRRMLSKFR